MESGSLSIYKFVNGNPSGADILIDTNKEYSRTVNTADEVVIRSGKGKASVWVNGTQYFRNVAIDTDNYAPVFGYNNADCTNLSHEVTISGVSVVRTDNDLPLMVQDLMYIDDCIDNIPKITPENYEYQGTVSEEYTFLYATEQMEWLLDEYPQLSISDIVNYERQERGRFLRIC